MGWLSPTSHSDLQDKWDFETTAYDENTETGARNLGANYGYYLHLFRTPTCLCTKIQVWVSSLEPANLSIDIYYDETWHSIHSGLLARESWQEIEIGSTQLVDSVRIKNLIGQILFVRELDFWGVAPAPPTNVQATDGDYTDKVRISWTKSLGASSYAIYRDGEFEIGVGDVDYADDDEADPPTITPGNAVASDGDYADKVALYLSGEGITKGTTHAYKVKAFNTEGYSEDSNTDGGYRGVSSLTYQWQRSAADSDADYSNIDGATTEAYNDTGAPADGSGRYYRCVENAAGAAQAISGVDRGYRIPVKPRSHGYIIG